MQHLPIKGSTPAESWLNVSQTSRQGVYVCDFQERHLGNPLIRSIHGGTVGMLIEYCAEQELKHHLAQKGVEARVELTSSSVDYLRVTKDAPLYGRAEVVRIGRRIGFIDTWCWQDSEDLPVSRGTCRLRIFES